MRQNRLKRYTIWLMGALGAMLVLWASFGSPGRIRHGPHAGTQSRARTQGEA